MHQLGEKAEECPEGRRHFCDGADRCDRSQAGSL